MNTRVWTKIHQLTVFSLNALVYTSRSSEHDYIVRRRPFQNIATLRILIWRKVKSLTDRTNQWIKWNFHFLVQQTSCLFKATSISQEKVRMLQPQKQQPFSDLRNLTWFGQVSVSKQHELTSNMLKSTGRWILPRWLHMQPQSTWFI